MGQINPAKSHQRKLWTSLCNEADNVSHCTTMLYTGRHGYTNGKVSQWKGSHTFSCPLVLVPYHRSEDIQSAMAILTALTQTQLHGSMYIKFILHYCVVWLWKPYSSPDPVIVPLPHLRAQISIHSSSSGFH